MTETEDAHFERVFAARHGAAQRAYYEPLPPPMSLACTLLERAGERGRWSDVAQTVVHPSAATILEARKKAPQGRGRNGRWGA